MKIVIPMAGLGTRFQQESKSNPEFLKPKPFILVRGIPMVRWATGSLPFLEHPGQKVAGPLRATMSDLIFIILKEHDDQHQIAAGLRKIYTDDIKIIVLPKLTRGAAETAYAAKSLVNENEEIIVSDSDHYFDGNNFAKAIEMRTESTDGIIPVFKAPEDGIPRWSYSLTDSENRILQVGEKDPDLMNRGAYANIGAYYFSKARSFFELVEEAIRKNLVTGDEGKKEFYVAPMYQQLINHGGNCVAAILPEVWGLGTPKDLAYFLEHTIINRP